ncbi:MAG: Cys-Gln thioester bond-forming surface protein [Bacilli bacterium]|nr:Cys-Gln thioester bond-forming surface protein [Bacilli bacterium]
MKNLKRFFCLTFVLLLTFMFTITSAKAAPTSITVIKDGDMYDVEHSVLPQRTPYLVPTDSSLNLAFIWAKLKTSDDKIAYCLDQNKEWPNNDSMSISNDRVRAGLVYILKNGYPNKRIIDSGDKDRYITQGAIWLYMSGVPQFGAEVTDVNGLLPYMVQLMSGAQSADAASDGDPSVNVSVSDTYMTEQDDYYVSKEVTVSLNGATTYSVSVSGVTGAEAVTTTGTAKTTFNANEKFKVRVPNSTALGAQVTAKITVSGHTYILAPGNSDTQRVIALYEDDASDEKTITFTTQAGVCVNYVIVGNVKPDPAKTDPTPDPSCYDKGTEYDQEKELTTRTNCTFKGWFTNEDLTGKWTNGTALMNDLTLYGAWDCPTTVVVPPTAANTPLIILGVGLTCIAFCIYYYLQYEKKSKVSKSKK